MSFILYVIERQNERGQWSIMHTYNDGSQARAYTNQMIAQDQRQSTLMCWPNPKPRLRIRKYSPTGYQTP